MTTVEILIALLFGAYAIVEIVKERGRIKRDKEQEELKTLEYLNDRIFRLEQEVKKLRELLEAKDRLINKLQDTSGDLVVAEAKISALQKRLVKYIEKEEEERENREKQE